MAATVCVRRRRGDRPLLYSQTPRLYDISLRGLMAVLIGCFARACSMCASVASCGAVLKPNTPPAFHAACRCQRFVVGSAPLWQAEAEPPADE